MGTVSVGDDLSVLVGGLLWSDSSAPIGIASRRGLGKVKRSRTQYLWIQERLEKKEYTLHKECTDQERLRSTQAG